MMESLWFHMRHPILAFRWYVLGQCQCSKCKSFKPITSSIARYRLCADCYVEMLYASRPKADEVNPRQQGTESCPMN